ncbi:Flp family type IVb pilin [Arthrobacter sp. R1-13]
MTSLMVSFLAMVAGVKDRLSNEKGATAVEYGLLVALIAAVIIGTVVILGGQIDLAFQTIVDQMPEPAAPVVE